MSGKQSAHSNIARIRRATSPALVAGFVPEADREVLGRDRAKSLTGRLATRLGRAPVRGKEKLTWNEHGGWSCEAAAGDDDVKVHDRLLPMTLGFRIVWGKGYCAREESGIIPGRISSRREDVECHHSIDSGARWSLPGRVAS